MIKKKTTAWGTICLVIGLFTGIMGAAFSMGADKQRINSELANNSVSITMMIASNEQHKVSIQKEMDRYVKIITAQTIQLQDSILLLTTTVGDLRTDVQVLKALIERIERDLQTKQN